MNYFEKIETLEELKTQYKKLAMKHHPDRGGDLETMQEINAEYDRLFIKVKDIHKNKAGATFTRETKEAPEEFRNIINELFKMAGVQFEIVGCFIWVMGETKPHKDNLKKLGFRWHSQKCCWYKAPADYKKTNKKSFTLLEIEDMYGVQFAGSGNDNKYKQLGWA